MKLRNILLTVAAVTACSSAFAANTLSQGGTYVGLAGGWGSITTDSGAVAILNTLNDGGAGSQSGGFSGRVYLGYLMSLNAGSNWLFGPELGYSYYANNTYTAIGWNADDSDLNIKQSGYGVDILLNATYLLSDSFSIAVKPGVQYAFEKFTTPNDQYGIIPKSSNVNKVMPEVNIGVNWQAFADKPFFVGASYQYVWGNSSNDINNLYDGDANLYTSSRDMLTLNLEYMFH